MLNNHQCRTVIPEIRKAKANEIRDFFYLEAILELQEKLEWSPVASPSCIFRVRVIEGRELCKIKQNINRSA